MKVMGIKKGVILKPPQDNENETWIYSLFL